MGSDLYQLSRQIEQDNFYPAMALLRRCREYIKLDPSAVGQQLLKDIADLEKRTTIR